MSQLIVILFLIVIIVRAVNAAKRSKGQDAKPPQSSARGQAEEPAVEKVRRRGRTARPKPAVETEGYAEYPRRETPAEPIACGNTQEHSHARVPEVRVTADDLRRAVITSEILSKPVSLRDE